MKNNIEPAIKAKLEKLMALANRGVGGEKETAETMLKRIMAEHNITMDMLGVENEEPHRAAFRYSTNHEKIVLKAIYSKVMNTHSIRYNDHYKGKLLFWLTNLQEVEMGVLYSIYRKDLKKHLELSTRAFIVANHIWADKELTDEELKDIEEKRKQETPEQRAERRRLAALAGNIDPSQVQKQLGHKS